MLEGSQVNKGQSDGLMEILVNRVLALIILFFSLPFIIVVWLVVYFDDGRPVVFAHSRLGKDGVIFPLFKFRTMVRDAEGWLKRDPELYKLYVDSGYKLPSDIDPRYTRSGRLLRALSLDEMPQLLNVLRGEMNVVGPRPIVADELARYEGHEEEFLSVKPGLTGLWQVKGRSTITGVQRKELDLEYIRNRSFIYDAKIIFLTIFAVLRGIGAH